MTAMSASSGGRFSTGAARVDLRRKCSREQSERIVRLAEWLPDSERALVTAVYGDGKAVAEVAALTGESPRVLRRRVRRAASRVLSREYSCVLRLRDSWPTSMKRVATACILHGMPLREAASSLKMSYHAVRRHRDRILAVCESAGALR